MDILRIMGKIIEQVLKLCKVVGSSGLYWIQACAWLCLNMWALILVKPAASGFTLN
jgi:hypothetical protein